MGRLLDGFHKVAGLALTCIAVLLASIVTGNVCAPLGYAACFEEKVLGRNSNPPTKVVAVPPSTASSGKEAVSEPTKKTSSQTSDKGRRVAPEQKAQPKPATRGELERGEDYGPDYRDYTR
jgi:hypothetical protein